MRRRKKMHEQENMPKDEQLQQEEAPVTDDGAQDVDAAPAQEAPAQEPAKNDEYLVLAQRIQADFDNYRRRNENAMADARADGKRDAAQLMLPVLDNLERAMSAAADIADDDPLKAGVALTLRQLNDVFAKMEITVIDRPGEMFDPNLENAVLQGSEDDGEPGTVCQVLQKGYMMGKKVLRHAMVKVVPE